MNQSYLAAAIIGLEVTTRPPDTGHSKQRCLMAGFDQDGLDHCRDSDRHPRASVLDGHEADPH
jgi:hypothetical protein